MNFIVRSVTDIGQKTIKTHIYLEQTTINGCNSKGGKTTTVVIKNTVIPYIGANCIVMSVTDSEDFTKDNIKNIFI